MRIIVKFHPELDNYKLYTEAGEVVENVSVVGVKPDYSGGTGNRTVVEVSVGNADMCVAGRDGC